MKHPRASSWFRPGVISARQIDPSIATWLHDQGSLTRRLVDRCGDDFAVRVLSQQWVKPFIEEARLLNVAPRQKVLLRQVQLLCGKEVLVYARSVIPLATLQGRHRRLKHLGEKPLGGYLFAHPELRREHQQLAKILPRDPLFDIALSGNPADCECIWGRRSLFKIDARSILVSEFFLPELIRD